MQRSRYTHIAKQAFPYSQESTTGSLPYLPLVVEQFFTIGKEHNLSLVHNLSIFPLDCLQILGFSSILGISSRQMILYYVNDFK